MGQSEEVLFVLDKYEGIYPQQPTAGEYRREKRAVRVKNGPINCWMYLYNLSTDDLYEIPNDNYVAYAMQNPGHQRFIASV